MKKLTAAAFLGATLLALPAPAMAQEAGDIQLKVFVTGVLPDGKIDEVKSASITLPAGTQAKAEDNWVPTIAAEYFLSPNFSVETICCMTQHDVMGAGALPGTAELVANAKIIPATLTLKAHAKLGPIKPYVGIGPSLYIFIDEKPGATMAAGFGATKLDIKNTVGVAFQGGVDMPLNEKVSLSVDAKKYILRPTAEWKNSTGVSLLKTKHKLDPLVISFGLGYKF